MKQLLIFGLLLFMFSCQDETDLISVEEPMVDSLIQYGLNRQLCTDEWQSARVIEFNPSLNEVTFAEPANFEALNTNLVITLDDDGEYGPSAYGLYSEVAVQAFGDTIRIQVEWQSLTASTLRACDSQYVKL